MKKAKVVRIIKGIDVGTHIPMKQKNGNIGNWADDHLKYKGHYVDKQGLIDLPDINVESKTRNEKSTAPHTVSSATASKIARFPSWEESDFYKKLVVRQYRVHFNDTTSTVTKSKIYDFSDSLEELGREYNILHAKLVKCFANYKLAKVENKDSELLDFLPDIIKATGKAVFDGYNYGNSYKFRIMDKMMKIMEIRAENSKALHANFKFN